MAAVIIVVLVVGHNRHHIVDPHVNEWSAETQSFPIFLGNTAGTISIDGEWQIYRNQSLRFEVSVPKNWVYTEYFDATAVSFEVVFDPTRVLTDTEHVALDKWSGEMSLKFYQNGGIEISKLPSVVNIGKNHSVWAYMSKEVHGESDPNPAWNNMTQVTYYIPTSKNAEFMWHPWLEITFVYSNSKESDANRQKPYEHILDSFGWIQGNTSSVTGK